MTFGNLWFKWPLKLTLTHIWSLSEKKRESFYRFSEKLRNVTLWESNRYSLCTSFLIEAPFNSLKEMKVSKIKKAPCRFWFFLCKVYKKLLGFQKWQPHVSRDSHLNLPGQLSWRTQKLQKRSSAAGKQFQIKFVVLEGPRW